MSKFVSKYATVEAVFFEEDESNREEVVGFGGSDIYIDDETSEVMIQTNNGDVALSPGNWLIQGVSDFYPCDPVTFAARWQETGPAGEYHANADAQVNAIQYLGEENRDAVLEFGGDKVSYGEDNMLRVASDSGEVILEPSMYLVKSITGYFISDPFSFMVRWIKNETPAEE